MKVIEEATARLIPGPEDDPAEAGHPGAREARVADYIAGMVGALGVSPPLVFAGGPYSNRHGGSANFMADFLPLSRSRETAWRTRLRTVKEAYLAGIKVLDAKAEALGAGSFTDLQPETMDSVLAANPTVPGLPSDYSGFTDMLFAHAIEGMYSAPEYRGNAGLAGWRDVGFPGDVQPDGYTPCQVTAPLRRGEYMPTPAVEAVLQIVGGTAPAPITGP
jgi:hypothetical protein